MAFNGAGVFERLFNWATDKANSVRIRADRMDSEMDGMATGLSNCITKDGQTTVTQNIPMNSHKLTGLSAGSSAGDSVRYEQISNTLAAEVTVASATTCDILGAASERVAISGTTTIESFGTGTNRIRFVRATGAFLITYNATTLITPTAANITTAAGDTFIVWSDASSNCRVLAYQRASGESLMQLSADAGAGIAPTFDLLRRSASPAASDLLAALRYIGKDDGAADQVYAQIVAKILDPAAGSEDGELHWYTVLAGTLAARMILGAGLQLGSPTGGDKGAGTINVASGIYLDGTALGGAARESFVATKSADQTISTSAATEITFDNEDRDIGSKFASNAWTPSAGPVLIGGVIHCSNLTASGWAVVVYKNGSVFGMLESKDDLYGATDMISGSVFDIANGTDAYTLRSITNADTSYLIEDASTYGTTRFWGTAI